MRKEARGETTGIFLKRVGLKTILHPQIFCPFPFRPFPFIHIANKDFQQLMDYNPWGKPGGGAPTRRIGKNNVFGEDGPVEHTFLAFGKPGHGAPNKTRSGRLRTRLPADPSIRFGVPSLQIVSKVVHHDPPPPEQMHSNDLDFSGAIFASTSRGCEPSRRRRPSRLDVVVETVPRESPVCPAAGSEVQNSRPGPVGLLEKLGWRRRNSPPPFSGLDDHVGRSFNLSSTDVTRQVCLRVYQ